MDTKRCPICHTIYQSHLPACPNCKESNIGGVKMMNKQTNKRSYEIGSYEKDLAHYHKEKRIVQYLAIIALCRKHSILAV